MAILSRSTSRPALNATRARQGRFGRHMFWVLLVSTALAALALFGAWTWRADDLASTAPNNAREPADAAPFNQGDPAALQTAPTSGG
jgi:hypothetical protein